MSVKQTEAQRGPVAGLLDQAHRVETLLVKALELITKLGDSSEAGQLRVIYGSTLAGISSTESWLRSCQGRPIAGDAVAGLRRIGDNLSELETRLPDELAKLRVTLGLTGRGPAAVVLGGPGA